MNADAESTVLLLIFLAIVGLLCWGAWQSFKTDDIARGDRFYTSMSDVWTGNREETWAGKDSGRPKPRDFYNPVARPKEIEGRVIANPGPPAKVSPPR